MAEPIAKDQPSADRRHPQAEATYRVIPLDNGSFGVEVTVPDTQPTKVSSFQTEADAETWIAEHKRRVLSQIQAGRGFRPRGWD